MKRSEVINKIKKSLIDQFLTCSEVTRNQCKNEAEYILDMLEELGMLPPVYTCVNPLLSKEKSFVGSCKLHEWEPEDEEK